jgi:hypothetical protein
VSLIAEVHRQATEVERLAALRRRRPARLARLVGGLADAFTFRRRGA